MKNEVIVVAVDATKEITDHALEWTLCNVIRSYDSFFLLALLPSSVHLPLSTSKIQHHGTIQFLSCMLKKWGLGQKEKKNESDRTGFLTGVEHDGIHKLKNVCALMMRQLFSAHNFTEVHREVKVVVHAQPGSVAVIAQELGATWVVLDRGLKEESGFCLKQLRCNIVLVDQPIPKILKAVRPFPSKKLSHHTKINDPSVAPAYNSYGNSYTTPRSSFGLESPNSRIGTSSSSSATNKDQPHIHSPITTNTTDYKSYIRLHSNYIHHKLDATTTRNPCPSNGNLQSLKKTQAYKINQAYFNAPAGQLEVKRRSYSGPLKTRSGDKTARQMAVVPARKSADSHSPCVARKNESPGLSRELFSTKDFLAGQNSKAPCLFPFPPIQRTSSIRRAVSLPLKHPPAPPPLCSVCKDNVPHLGKAPKKFCFEEIERATNGFAMENLLAEGGFGPVYKGVLPDGQVIAVKKHKSLSAQGAAEFCSEVELLSCAQHKNLVMLVGYCIEKEWVLVYEFACNGSLDRHLYGKGTAEVMTWQNRMKVAVGAARGLRYLHEECRVGCIVHRDFRPNNILLTHDFKPMVGDFGLARWQADGQKAEETRIVGAFGYLAPEYTQTGLITEKADVYAYGIVLLELLRGFKATEFSRNTGKQFASEWGLPLLKSGMIKELIDPRLANDYVSAEVRCMMYAAELCLSPLPQKRPRMSQVLKILEGDLHHDSARNSEDGASLYSNGNMGINNTPQLIQMHLMNRSPLYTSDKEVKVEKRTGCSTPHSSVPKVERHSYDASSPEMFTQV